MSLPENQPTPTRCPTFSLLVLGPKAVICPTASWPRMTGYLELPQSLFSTERSERQRPQCSTATSTSSGPSDPRSTSSSAIGCFAPFAIHALHLVESRIPKDVASLCFSSLLS